MDSLPEDAGAGPLAVLSRFRRDFHACLTGRANELSELADAVLCADGPVRALAGLSLAPEHRRGHGALYDAVNHGRIDIARLRRSLAGLPLPRAADGRLMLAADVSNWLRPGAPTSPGRLFCHVYGRGKGQAQMIPGWPYSVIAALEPGRTSWTAVLDAVRLGPDDDETAVTATQVRDVITRLMEAGHWHDGDPPILVVFDAGYDVTRSCPRDNSGGGRGCCGRPRPGSTGTPHRSGLRLAGHHPRGHGTTARRAPGIALDSTPMRLPGASRVTTATRRYAREDPGMALFVRGGRSCSSRMTAASLRRGRCSRVLSAADRRLRR